MIIPYTYDGSALGAEIGIMFCMSLIAGAFLYAVNFYLVKNTWFNKLTGMYKEVGEIYYDFDNFPEDLNDIFNIQSNNWFNEAAFISKNEMDNINNDAKKEIYKLQDKFYSKAYYQLEYLEKISVPKTFQSFYFFFRQLATGLLLVIVLLFILSIISWFNVFNLHQPNFQIIPWLWFGLISTFLLSVSHARWYRSRMVFKLYWHYYIHLIQANYGNNGNF
jgi:hypothetical protein